MAGAQGFLCLMSEMLRTHPGCCSTIALLFTQVSACSNHSKSVTLFISDSKSLWVSTHWCNPSGHASCEHVTHVNRPRAGMYCRAGPMLCRPMNNVGSTGVLSLNLPPMKLESKLF